VGGQRVVNTKRQPAFVLRGTVHGSNAVGGQRVVNTESHNSILSLPNLRRSWDSSKLRREEKKNEEKNGKQRHTRRKNKTKKKPQRFIILVIANYPIIQDSQRSI